MEKKSKKIITDFKRTFYFFFCCITLLSCTNERTESAEPTSNDNIEEISALIEDGDIILKRGRGEISRIIVNKLKEKIPFSHCGILVKEKDSIYIIHSVAREVSGSDGVQSMNLVDFLDDCYNGSVFICRVKSGEKSKENISLTAREYLQARVPFDYQFDYANKDQLYCSELVYNVLMDVYEVDFFKKSLIESKNILTFNSLLDSSYFSVIPIK